jgi:hypothetical protein
MFDSMGSLEMNVHEKPATQPLCQPPNKQLLRTDSGVSRGAPHVRHFIMHMRRGGRAAAELRRYP